MEHGNFERFCWGSIIFEVDRVNGSGDCCNLISGWPSGGRDLSKVKIVCVEWKDTGRSGYIKMYKRYADMEPVTANTCRLDRFLSCSLQS